MDRRRMMGGKKMLVLYELGTSPAYSYIQLNGEGEKLFGSGEIEVKSGEFLLCYLYAAYPKIKLDGAVVAESEEIRDSITYEFYPKSDAKIEVRTGSDDAGMHVVITTGGKRTL